MVLFCWVVFLFLVIFFVKFCLEICESILSLMKIPTQYATSRTEIKETNKNELGCGRTRIGVSGWSWFDLNRIVVSCENSVSQGRCSIRWDEHWMRITDPILVLQYVSWNVSFSDWLPSSLASEEKLAGETPAGEEIGECGSIDGNLAIHALDTRRQHLLFFLFQRDTKPAVINTHTNTKEKLISGVPLEGKWRPGESIEGSSKDKSSFSMAPLVESVKSSPSPSETDCERVNCDGRWGPRTDRADSRHDPMVHCNCLPAAGDVIVIGERCDLRSRWRSSVRTWKPPTEDDP